MKKYILTESQVKKIVDNLLKEQTDIQLTTATAQCFLNQVMNAKLIVDGINGDATIKVLKAFQQKKVSEGHRIDIDGVWGYNTQSTLTPEEKNIWKKCLRKYGTRP